MRVWVNFSDREGREGIPKTPCICACFIQAICSWLYRDYQGGSRSFIFIKILFLWKVQFKSENKEKIKETNNKLMSSTNWYYKFFIRLLLRKKRQQSVDGEELKMNN